MMKSVIVGQCAQSISKIIECLKDEYFAWEGV